MEETQARAAATGEALIPSRWVALIPARRLTCPAGHRLAVTAVIPEHGFLRCAGQRHTHGDCGEWVWVYQFRGGLALVVQVTLEEQRTCADLRTPAEVIEVLDLITRVGGIP